MIRLSVYEEISLAKYGIQVNVNARTCTFGWMDGSLRRPVGSGKDAPPYFSKEREKGGGLSG